SGRVRVKPDVATGSAGVDGGVGSGEPASAQRIGSARAGPARAHSSTTRSPLNLLRQAAREETSAAATLYIESTTNLRQRRQHRGTSLGVGDGVHQPGDTQRQAGLERGTHVG